MVISRQAHYPVSERGSRDKLNNVERESAKRHCLEIKLKGSCYPLGCNVCKGRVARTSPVKLHARARLVTGTMDNV